MDSRTSDRWSGIILAAVLVVGMMAIFTALTMPRGGYYGMMGGAPWGWGALMMVVFALILIVLAVALLGVLWQPSAPSAYSSAHAPTGSNAFDVLEARYARGELNREEYIKIRGDLGHGSVRP